MNRPNEVGAETNTERAMSDLAEKIAGLMPDFTVAWDAESVTLTPGAVGDIRVERGRWTGIHAVEERWLSPDVTRAAAAQMLATKLRQMWERGNAADEHVALTPTALDLEHLEAMNRARMETFRGSGIPGDLP
jgi:hypothetical protein